MMTHNQAVDTLETLVDQFELCGTLELLAEVCSAKADHIRENWQDERTAKAWDDAVPRILKAKQILKG